MRKKFDGEPEHVINYFFMLAEEVRQLMAQLGFRSFQEMIGRTDKLKASEQPANEKCRMLDFSRILQRADEMRVGVNIIGGSKEQNFNLGNRLVS